MMARLGGRGTKSILIIVKFHEVAEGCCKDILMAEHAAFLATPNIYLSANRSLSTRLVRKEFGLDECVLIYQGSRGDGCVGLNSAHFDMGNI